MNLAIIGLLELIAILTGSKQFFVLSGLAILIFGITYWATSEYLAIILAIAGIVNMSLGRK